MSAVEAAEQLPEAPPGANALVRGQHAAVRRLRLAVGTARSYGPLRRCTPDQAPVIRLAAEVDPGVLPRWQRGGDGHHQWAEPGDYLGVLGWTSRQHWLDVVVTAATRDRPEPLERRGVSTAMFLAWCDTVSLFAHRRTGRRCIVRPDRLAELMGVAKRTVQRCQKAAEDLGLYVVIVPGRMLNEEEVRACRDHGSRQRGLSNDAALVVPSWLASKISMPDFGRERSKVTPTRGRYRSHFKLTVISSFTPRSAGTTEPTSSARHRRNRPRRSSGPSPVPTPRHATPSDAVPAAQRPGRIYDLEALALARELVLRVRWLDGVAPGRLEPGLRRFTACRVPWTAGDIATAIDAHNRRLSRAAMTKDLVRAPHALLASYLRDLDPDADHPLGPDYVPDPTRPRRTELSRVQEANSQRAAAARMRANASSDEARARAIARIREQLHSQHGGNPSDTSSDQDEPLF